MLRHVVVLAAWLALVAGVMVMLFDDQRGLFQHGPVTAIGIALLGAAIARHRQAAEPQDEQPAPAAASVIVPRKQ